MIKAAVAIDLDHAAADRGARRAVQHIDEFTARFEQSIEARAKRIETRPA